MENKESQEKSVEGDKSELPETSEGAESAGTPEGAKSAGTSEGAESAGTSEGAESTELTEEKEKDPSQEGETYAIEDVVNKAGYGKFQKILTFLAGLGWLADAFEVIILSIIGDLLACDWPIERWQNAVMTSVVFLGMTLGAPMFGNFADRFGRRTALAISMLLLFIFGAASAAAPNYVWMLVLRALMGFALGGIAQGVTLCCEYYPASVRGRAGFYLSYYWTVGCVLMVASAWLVMSKMNNWRVFVFVAAVPALIVFLTMKWYPESARYYLVSNQPEKAKKTLQRLVKMNKSEMPPGRLVYEEATEQQGRIGDLLSPKMRRSTLLFWYIWLSVAMGYYGVALITPHIITEGSLLKYTAKKNTSFFEDFREIMPCKKFSNQEFFDMLWTTSAEFPGVFTFSYIVGYVPRRLFLGTAILINAFLMLLLMLEIKPQIALFIILFLNRGIVAGTFQLLFIMTTEAFPTTLRASAMGTGSGCARFGGLLIPYITQIGVFSKPIPSMMTLSAIFGLAGIAALCLPMETRGREMEDKV